MFKNLAILFAAGLVIALPFLFRQEAEQTNWNPGDPELVVISSHNEAIRYEFGKGFSDWHEEHHGSPVRVDWRVIGGTSETIRYLQSEMMSSYRGWWSGEGKEWPGDGAKIIYDYRSDTSRESELFKTLRSTDNPDNFGIKIDVFFGGGEYDHAKVAKQGITVKPWDTAPAGITGAYPTGLSGETWRTDVLFGNALSTFGLCYNLDRLADLGRPDQVRQHHQGLRNDHPPTGLRPGGRGRLQRRRDPSGRSRGQGSADRLQRRDHPRLAGRHPSRSAYRRERPLLHRLEFEDPDRCRRRRRGSRHVHRLLRPLPK